MVIGLSLTANCWLFTGFEYRQILPSQNIKINSNNNSIDHKNFNTIIIIII